MIHMEYMFAFALIQAACRNSKKSPVNVFRYLRLSREKDPTLPMKDGVDTLLMYLYRALNRVEEMEALASSENNCVVV